MFLTFDDGPHPQATPFVLDALKEAGAVATFFCIGKNVVAYPELYQRIIAEGHQVGNHTQTHLNGWKTGTEVYLDDVRAAASVIHSALFRPPYGRLKHVQARGIAEATGHASTKIVMWDVLSGDFDERLTGEQCTRYVKRYAKPGSIIVFHDSEKAFSRLRIALPELLHYFNDQRLTCARLE